MAPIGAVNNIERTAQGIYKTDEDRFSLAASPTKSEAESIKRLHDYMIICRK